MNPAGADPKAATYGAISGMIETLGDNGHSAFLTPEMVRQMKERSRGQFKGIGIEIQVKAGQLVIIAPIDGSPAQKAGLKAGEVILRVDGQDITDWPVERVVQAITGKTGTKAALTVLNARTGQSRDVSVTRASIRLKDVTWLKLPGTSLAHLRVASFDPGVTRDLRVAIGQIRHENVTGIILDLRNNPGGYLDEAIGVASEFLTGGNVLISKNGAGESTPVPVQTGGTATNVPMVVLINAGTASAAEIVAGALEDAGRAPLIGETTFGTGTVLAPFGLKDGSALLLAVEEWLTPNGRSFWHKGLNPTVRVALPPDISALIPATEENMNAEELRDAGDSQLLKATSLLTRRTGVSTDSR